MKKGRAIVRIPVIGGAILLAMAGVAQANQPKTYTYDALGRLVKVEKENQQAQPIVTDIEYDDAGNRKRYAVTGAPDQPPNGGDGSEGGRIFIVIPLNGYTVIPAPKPPS